MEVQILSRKFIKPSSPTPPPLKKINLSLIDQLAPSVHVGCVFYYPIVDPNVRDTIASSVERLSQLEKSLSETLALFYPLAGRYMNDEDLSIDCNNAGVVYWEAQVNVELANIVHGRPELQLLSLFLPLDFGAADISTTPLVAIQVNIFNCGGLAIGVLISHKVADAFTLVAFIDAWAKASRGAIGEVIHPSFELASLIPSRFSHGLKSPNTPRKKGECVPRKFVFDGAAITSLKAKVGGLPTRLEVVSALMWRALIGTSQEKHGYLRTSLLVHAVNLRGKTVLLTPENACGNFYTLATARFRPGETKMELHDLAGLVGDSIRNAQTHCKKMMPGGNDFFCSVTESFREPTEDWGNDEVDIYMFTSWCRFPFYEADFGWGNPTWVSSHMPAEVIALVDSKCGKGIEAWISLDEQEVLYFQQDQDIAVFSS